MPAWRGQRRCAPPHRTRAQWQAEGQQVLAQLPTRDSVLCSSSMACIFPGAARMRGRRLVPVCRDCGVPLSRTDHACHGHGRGVLRCPLLGRICRVAHRQQASARSAMSTGSKSRLCRPILDVSPTRCLPGSPPTAVCRCAMPTTPAPRRSCVCVLWVWPNGTVALLARACRSAAMRRGGAAAGIRFTRAAPCNPSNRAQPAQRRWLLPWRLNASAKAYKSQRSSSLYASARHCTAAAWKRATTPRHR